ncbi:MAG TPA: flagellar biosynthesis protein FlhB [Spirochaetia bacterium]|nr:flagellar biosynthesis protein FlhB [Spirochaetia bacterium]
MTNSIEQELDTMRYSVLLPSVLPLTQEFGFVDIQWFAAEDEGRTEEPTEYKLRKAREEGRVARSTELSSAILLLFSIITLAILMPYIISTTMEMMQFFFSSSTKIDVTNTKRVAPIFLLYFVKIAAPLAGVAFVAALAGNLIQVGFKFSAKPITPDFSRIVPKFGTFFKRAFASGETAFNLALSIAKIVAVGLIVYLNVKANLGLIVNFVSMPFALTVHSLLNIAFKIMLESAIVLLVIAIPDYFFQKRQYIESLKMSKQELKEERRMNEGDPLVKSRLRDRMRDILSKSMLANVPKADVIITNPTHFAVGLQFKRGRMIAPMVIAKGQDNLALAIRRIAEEHNVPIVENKPLARALYAEVELGDVIPDKYYEVIALILAQVYEMGGRREEAFA